MYKYVSWEWRKEARLVRFWGSLCALAVMGGLFTYGYVNLRHKEALLAIVGMGASDGFFVPVLAVSVSATILLPFFVTIVSGDAISGERQWGTWPLLLSQGVSPWRLYGAKWIVGLTYAGLATLTLVLSSALGGFLVMGWHATALPSGIMASAWDQVRLLALMTAYVSVGQMAVASLAITVSAFFRNTLSTVLVVMGVLLVMVMIGEFPVFSTVQRFLLTDYFSQAQAVLSAPPNWLAMERGILVFFLYGMCSWMTMGWFEPFRD